MAPPSLPPRLVSSVPGTWAHATMSDRIHSQILSRMLADNAEALSSPAFAAVNADLLSLRDEVQSSEPLLALAADPYSPDVPLWNSLLAPYPSDTTYLTAPWLLAEFYVYRRVIQSLDYSNPASPGHLLDPFLRQKGAGLASSYASADALLERLGPLLRSRELPGLTLALFSSLWGNRMDLSIWPADASETEDVFSGVLASSHANLLSDDSPSLFSDLLSSPSPLRVDLIVDNAGFELITDLAFADYLLSSSLASSVTFRVKAHPTFVSDATPADLLSHVEAYAASPLPNCAAAGERWRAHLSAGRFLVKPDAFWCQPLAMAWEMPPSLRSEMEGGCDLAVVKGDANYRRLLDDRAWDLVGDRFGDVVSEFPTSVVALRTLKAEIGCGMEQGKVEEARGADPDDWMVTGKYGVVQYHRKGGGA